MGTRGLKLGMGKRILFVDDDQRFIQMMSYEFTDHGHQVVAAHNLTELKEVLLTNESNPFAYAIIDLRIGSESGLSALEIVLKANAETRAIILTGFSSVATAVRAVKEGAHQYLAKPISYPDLEKSLFEEASNELIDQDQEIEEKLPSLARKEREYIEFVLDQCDGNITQAAKKLGLHRQSLQRKLKKYTPSN